MLAMYDGYKPTTKLIAMNEEPTYMYIFYRLFISVMLLEIQLSGGEGWDSFNRDPVLRMGEAGIALTGLSPPHVCPGTGISNVICRGIFSFRLQ
jgi:hypothetical protein